MKRYDKFYVYIIEDRNGVYYTGYTNDLKERVERHAKGQGAKFLRGRGPFKLVFQKEYRYYKNALNAERKIKHYPRKRKEELVRIYANSY